jgi:hypothetical protein
LRLSYQFSFVIYWYRSFFSLIRNIDSYFFCRRIVSIISFDILMNIDFITYCYRSTCARLVDIMFGFYDTECMIFNPYTWVIQHTKQAMEESTSLLDRWYIGWMSEFPWGIHVPPRLRAACIEATSSRRPQQCTQWRRNKTATLACIRKVNHAADSSSFSNVSSYAS